MNRDELRNPRVPHLRDVGRSVADEAGEQLLVRRGPRNLLHVDVNAGAPLELRHHLGDDFTFSP